jgi:glycosyltransferase involved in cell wall biosynthesis
VTSDVVLDGGGGGPDRRNRPSLSVVIPCYRSQEIIGDLVEELHAVLSDWTYEIVLVVDGSPDDTWHVVQSLANDENTRGVLLMRNYGQHNAILAGALRANHDVIVTMDDDFQHPPAAIPELVAALEDGDDLVYGVAISEEHGFWRSLASRVVKGAMAMSLGVDHAQKISAFRAFRRSLVDPLQDLIDAFVSLDVCLSWTTDRVTAVPVEMADRRSGRSNYSVRMLFGHALNMITGYSSRPLRLMTVVGLGTSLLGFGLLIYVLVLFFTGTTQVAGFTTIASMVAMFAGAQMFALGLMGEYIGRLHFRSMSRPTFIVRDSTDGENPHSQ